MSCCGNQREREASAAPPARIDPVRARPLASGVVFEYAGKTSLTVTGAASGRQYRFDRPGTRVVVDARDRPGVALVPNLRQIGSV